MQTGKTEMDESIADLTLLGGRGGRYRTDHMLGMISISDKNTVIYRDGILATK